MSMSGIDPISAASELWQAAKTAKSLYDGVTGTYDNASDRIKGLNFSIEQYRKTFQDLQSILRREQKTPEGYDGFVQTLKECDDFLKSYNSLQNGKAFGVKPKLSPLVLFHSFRYVFVEKDIARLEQRIVLQMTLVNAVINMIIAKNLADSVSTQALTSTLTNIEEEGSLGQTKWQHKRPLTTTDQDGAKELYDILERIQYRLKRVGPQAHKPHSIQTSHIDSAEFQRVSEALKGRLLRNEPQPLTHLNYGTSSENDFLETSQERLRLLLTSEDDLLKFSRERLKYLLSVSRNLDAPTTRIRIFGPDSEAFSLPQPAIANAGAISSATIYIPNTDLPAYELHSIDIVSDGSLRHVVCTEKKMRMGIIHFRKLVNNVNSQSKRSNRGLKLVQYDSSIIQRVAGNLYPFTKHRKISPSHYDKEVSIIESSTVEITGEMKGSFSDVSPLYSFGQHTDMIAFQNALRGGFLTKTFDVNTVKGKTVNIASSTHLKVWIYDDGIQSQSLTFYGNKLDPQQFLEFEISWFEPKIKMTGNTLLLAFRLPPKTKKKPRGFSLGSLRRRSSSEVSSDKHTSDSPAPRLSMASEISTTDIVEEAPEMQSIGITIQCLKIEFTTSGEMKKFSTLFSSIHEKLNLPIELPHLAFSPSLLESFPDHLRDTPRTRPTFENASGADPFSPGTSPGTIASSADSVFSSNATIRSAVSFTTTAPSEYSRRTSSIVTQNKDFG